MFSHYWRKKYANWHDTNEARRDVLRLAREGRVLNMNRLSRVIAPYEAPQTWWKSRMIAEKAMSSFSLMSPKTMKDDAAQAAYFHCFCSAVQDRNFPGPSYTFFYLAGFMVMLIRVLVGIRRQKRNSEKSVIRLPPRPSGSE